MFHVRLRKTASRTLGFLLDLGAEHTCSACFEPRPRAAAFCAACAARLVRYRGKRWLGSVPVLSPFAYSKPLSTAIAQLKYHGRTELGRLLAPYLVSTLRRSGACSSGAFGVVPVPLHSDRLLSRGYNQSALLGREVARGLGARFLPTALERERETASQAQLTRTERAENVSSAFAVRKTKRLRDASVLLLDDVITTGSTCSACIEALRGAGADVRAAVSLAVRDFS